MMTVKAARLLGGVNNLVEHLQAVVVVVLIRASDTLRRSARFDPTPGQTVLPLELSAVQVRCPRCPRPSPTPRATWSKVGPSAEGGPSPDGRVSCGTGRVDELKSVEPSWRVVFTGSKVSFLKTKFFNVFTLCILSPAIQTSPALFMNAAQSVPVRLQRTRASPPAHVPAFGLPPSAATYRGEPRNQELRECLKASRRKTADRPRASLGRPEGGDGRRREETGGDGEERAEWRGGEVGIQRTRGGF